MVITHPFHPDEDFHESRPAVIDHLDDLAGDALEQIVQRHHRRRLTKLGRAEVLAPSPPAEDLWVPGPRGPRPGNTVDVLIDGDQALGAMYEAMLAAKSHIHIAGWHLTPDFRLRRDDDTPTLQDLLAELSQRVDVRVLLWAGPPLPLFQPTRPAMKSIRDQLVGSGRIQCVLDARERTLHCHHEKIIVIDDEVAFVGGIDLSDLAGDRWDRNVHPPRGATGWHDVATRLRGPVVTDVAQHFRDRWQEVARVRLPAPAEQPAAGEVTVQLLRTVPERTYRFAPRGEFSILDGYLRALRSAERLVYLENQFLWSTEVIDVLIDKLKSPPHPDFRMVLVLPAKPSNGADTTRGQLGRLLDADNNAGRLLPATVTAHADGRADALYVHAKVGVIDDKWLTIGSANLNEHSLFNDTEVNILTLDHELARATRLRLWAEHLERPVSDIDGDPTAVVDSIWTPLAHEQRERMSADLPPTHRVTRLAAVSRRTARFIGPMRGLLVDA